MRETPQVGRRVAHLSGVQFGNSSESTRCGEKLKNLPIPFLKILPAVAMLSLASGCHTSTISVEASTTRVPVVAPAGTVLRVRLGETLDSGRSRPGDRFTGALDSPVMAGTMEVLAKGTVVIGHVLSACALGKDGEARLVVTLDSYERDGHWYALATNSVARIAHRDAVRWFNKGTNWNVARISLPAESIIGFTLASTLAA